MATFENILVQYYLLILDEVRKQTKIWRNLSILMRCFGLLKHYIPFFKCYSSFLGFNHFLI